MLFIFFDFFDNLFVIIIKSILKIMFTKNLVYKFATKAFDLAVIGGGPGGISF